MSGPLIVRSYALPSALMIRVEAAQAEAREMAQRSAPRERLRHLVDLHDRLAKLGSPGVPSRP